MSNVSKMKYRRYVSNMSNVSNMSDMSDMSDMSNRIPRYSMKYVSNRRYMSYRIFTSMKLMSDTISILILDNDRHQYI